MRLAVGFSKSLNERTQGGVPSVHRSARLFSLSLQRGSRMRKGCSPRMAEVAARLWTYVIRQQRKAPFALQSALLPLAPTVCIALFFLILLFLALLSRRNLESKPSQSEALKTRRGRWEHELVGRWTNRLWVLSHTQSSDTTQSQRRLKSQCRKKHCLW